MQPAHLFLTFSHFSPKIPPAPPTIHHRQPSISSFSSPLSDPPRSNSSAAAYHEGRVSPRPPHRRRPPTTARHQIGDYFAFLVTLTLTPDLSTDLMVWL